MYFVFKFRQFEFRASDLKSQISNFQPDERMSNVATSDNHEPASFRAYFWSYSTQELAEELSEELGAVLKRETDVEWSLQVDEGTWTVTARGKGVRAQIVNFEDFRNVAEVRPDHAQIFRDPGDRSPLFLPELARQVDFPERAFGRRDRVSICLLRTSHKGMKRLRPTGLFQLTLLRCFDTDAGQHLHTYRYEANKPKDTTVPFVEHGLFIFVMHCAGHNGVPNFNSLPHNA